MAGLVEEAQSLMKEEATPSVMDAALIAAAQTLYKRVRGHATT